MAPRPASTMNFSLPTSMSVQGPKRSNLGGGAPLPRRVTRKRSLDGLAMNSTQRRQDHSPCDSIAYHTLPSRNGRLYFILCRGPLLSVSRESLYSPHYY